MQTISLKTAKRLKELGLKHEPEIGDYYSGGAIYGTTLDSRGFAFSQLEDVWLPRLDQVMDEIERLVPIADIRFGAPGLHPELRFCEVSYPMRGYVHMVGPHDTEAAGLVLVEIMEMHGVLETDTPQGY